MRILLLAALSALPVPVSIPHAPPRYRAWQWERTVQPAPSAPADEQCVVLDADLYAASAPGLRDVRLLQDGQEIAYALQESYDERALHTEGDGDRSVYTTVLTVPLSGEGRWEQGAAVLPQHVPVERIDLIENAAPALPSGAIHMRLVVTPNAAAPVVGEVIEVDLAAASPVERTAIGANLQRSARVDLGIDPGEGHYSKALLQMRQRSLCYQPLSAAPLLLLYGNADAPPVRYAYAAHYQPRAQALLASFGPAQRNEDYHPKAQKPFTLTRNQRSSLAVFVAAAGFLLMAVPLLRRR